MIAQSEKLLTGVGGTNNLFAKQVPSPTTTSLKTTADVKKYQLVLINADGTVTAATTISATSKYGVTAYAAKAAEQVAVYMSGSFNVEALDLSAITAIASGTADQKRAALIVAASGTLQFETLSTDNVQPV